MSEIREVREVRCLSIHADYRCRDSGACCSSAWPIPIEIPLYERLVDALGDGSIRVVDASRPPFAPVRALPEGAAAVLGQTDDGRCVFYDADAEAKRCRIQRVNGHGAIPVACQQFPRMSLLDARGTHITLSHYCPTAAAMLFEERPLTIVRNPPAFPTDFPYEGLDAREAFPPLLRPGVLLDWHTLDAFETHAVRRLDAETHSVDAALADIGVWAERLRMWNASDGPMLATFERIIDESFKSTGASASARVDAPTVNVEAANFETLFQFDAEVRAAVPAGSVIQGAATQRIDASSAAGTMDAYERWVHPAWTAYTRPLCRYLAARLFANWCWYQGDGVRSLLRSLHAALAVLRLDETNAGHRHYAGRARTARGVPAD